MMMMSIRRHLEIIQAQRVAAEMELQSKIDQTQVLMKFQSVEMKQLKIESIQLAQMIKAYDVTYGTKENI